MPASGLPIALEVLILFPWDPVTRLFLGERIWFDRGEISSHEAPLKNPRIAGVLVCECGK